MKKTLNGTARLELKDGAIKGINLSAIAAQCQVACSLAARRENRTGRECRRENRFLRTERKLRHQERHRPQQRFPRQVAVPAPDRRRRYQSSREHPELRCEGRSGGEQRRQGGKDLGDLNGLTIPVRASGPFAALKYKIEFGSVLSDSAKQKLEEKKERTKDNGGQAQVEVARQTR